MTPEEREKMILENYGLVIHIVRVLSLSTNPVMAQSDYQSHGAIGLITAVDRYRSTTDTAFSSFAWPRIQGSAIDAFRESNGAIRHHNGDVTIPEWPLSLDAPIYMYAEDGNTNLSLSDNIVDPMCLDPLAEIERQERQERIAAALRTLPTHWRLIVAARCLNPPMTYLQIGQCLDLSERGVHYAYHTALSRLQNLLEEYAPAS